MIGIKLNNFERKETSRAVNLLKIYSKVKKSNIFSNVANWL